MRVKVKLFGNLVQLARNVNGRIADVELPDGATVDDLAVKLGIEEIAAVVCVNDAETHRGKHLQDGDVIAFFPPLAGG